MEKGRFDLTSPGWIAVTWRSNHNTDRIESLKSHFRQETEVMENDKNRAAYKYLSIIIKHPVVVLHVYGSIMINY